MAEAEKKKSEASNAEGEPEKKKSKLLIIILASVVLLAGGGGAAFYFLSSSKDSAKEAPPSLDEPTEAPHEGKPGEGEHGESDAAADKKGEHPENNQAHSDAAATKDASEHTESKDTGGEHGEGTAKDSKDKAAALLQINFGATYNLKPFHLNLGNPLENRYVRLEIALEYKQGKEQEQEITARLPQLRDAIISVASRKTREFLLGPDGKDQLRLEILNRVNQYMDKKIESVFITDMLIE